MLRQSPELDWSCKSTWQLPRMLGWEKTLVQAIGRKLLYSFSEKSGLWLRTKSPRGAKAAELTRAKKELHEVSPGKKPSLGKRPRSLAKALPENQHQGPESSTHVGLEKDGKK